MTVFTTGQIAWNELDGDASESEIRENIEDFLSFDLDMDQRAQIDYELTLPQDPTAPLVEFRSENDGLLVEVLTGIEVHLYGNHVDQRLFDTLQRSIKRVED